VFFADSGSQIARVLAIGPPVHCAGVLTPSSRCPGRAAWSGLALLR